jgi:Protein of unknown function (DUF3396)
MNPITVPDKDETLLVRQAWLLAFFANRPIPEMGEGAAYAFDEWIRIVPRKEIRWSLIGSSASEHKQVTEKTFGQCRSMLDKPKASARSMTAFELLGPEKFNPAFRFMVVGEGSLDAGSTYNTLMEIVLPWEFMDTLGIEPLVNLSLKVASNLPFDSGYLSPALNWGKDSKRREAGEAMIGHAMRHPGLDVHMNDATRLRLGKLARGGRWITFLGPDSIKVLGGAKKLAMAVNPGADVINTGAGLALRAGKTPAIGDVNRKDDLPLLRSVAQSIESVTYFNDRLLQTALFPRNADAYYRWERRFF